MDSHQFVGSFAFAGILFGVLVLSCGVIGWLMPQYVRLLGAFAMILSIVSIIGALGGLIELWAGALCIAWGPASQPSQENNGEKEQGGGGQPNGKLLPRGSSGLSKKTGDEGGDAYCTLLVAGSSGRY